MTYSDITIVGTVLNNRYEIINRIGKGGYSKVFLAHDKHLRNKPRAIKQLNIEFVNQDQFNKAVEDFKREAVLLASLDHPSIPQIYDYFLADGYYYLVMKYIEGKTLLEMLLKSPAGHLSEADVTRWSIQICSTLEYIHKNKPPIIYRDMKPENLMLAAKDELFLIDFGVARFVETTQKSVTAVGTIGYAAPELYNGHVTPETDIYSLGATMYHLLTGMPPRFNPAKPEWLSSNSDPRDLNDSLSEEMAEIILKAVQTDPKKRYTAIEMKIILQSHLLGPQRAKKQPTIKPQELKQTDVSVQQPTAAQSQAAQSQSDAQSNPEVFQTFAYPPKDWRSKEPPVTTFARLKLAMIEVQITKASFLIGRPDLLNNIRPDLDLTAIDNSGQISRRHAMITQENGKYYFEDLKSANGSLLNNIIMSPNNRRELKNGDRIKIGGTVMEFLI